MRTTNPVLNERAFSGARFGTDAMTVRGTVEKTLGLLFLVFCGAIYTWSTTRADGASAWIAVGATGGFIMALITIFKQSWAPITAPIYAVLEGCFLGGVSAIFEARYHGI